MQKTGSGYPSNEVATHPIDCPFINWVTGSCRRQELRRAEFLEFKSLMRLIMKLRDCVFLIERVDDATGALFVACVRCCRVCAAHAILIITDSVCILNTFGLFSGSFYGGGGGCAVSHRRRSWQQTSVYHTSPQHRCY